MIKDKNPAGFPIKGDTDEPIGDSRFDFNALPEDIQEFAKEKLTGDETDKELIEKLFKIAQSGEKKISTQGSELGKLKVKFSDFVADTGAGHPIAKPSVKEPVSDGDKVVDLEEREAALTQRYDDYDKRLDNYNQKLGQMEALHRSDVNERAAEKLERGLANLVEKVGLDMANQYFNPEDIPNSPVGQLLNPDVNPECNMFWRTPDPVWAAFKFAASVGEIQKIKVQAVPTPTEGAGGVSLPGEVSEGEEMEDEFFRSAGIDPDKLK